MVVSSSNSGQWQVEMSNSSNIPTTWYTKIQVIQAVKDSSRSEQQEVMTNSSANSSSSSNPVNCY